MALFCHAESAEQQNSLTVACCAPFCIAIQCMQVTTRSFGFATKRDLPLFYVSASNGTNVVKVRQ